MAAINKRKQIGDSGEKQVAQYLEQRGFTIVCMNYRTRRGEIDLIATKDDTIAFVEVKARTRTNFDLSAVITHTKQTRIAYAAKSYISRTQQQDKLFRFDVALVEANKPITYIPDAFWIHE